MIVNATDLKNNLGKYLRAVEREDVIITSNGRKIAKLTVYTEEYAADPTLTNETVKEKAEAYSLFPREATFEEFLQLSEHGEDRYEYIDGVIYFLAAPKTTHQQVLGELFGNFYNWFSGKKCRPLLAPYDITLKRNAENINIVQPDLMVICDLEDKLNEKDSYMGVPSLLVEILSESSRGKDAVKKLDLYMSTGVKEYWIVNPFNREVTLFLFENNDVLKNTTYKNNETVSSYIFEGFKVDLKDIF